MRAPSGGAQTLRLLFLDSGRPQIPTAAVTPLWTGGLFDLDYNPGHPPMIVPVPNFTDSSNPVSSLVLVAFITGHGWGLDVHDCAEFCVTEVSAVNQTRRALGCSNTLTGHNSLSAVAPARVCRQQQKHVPVRAE